MDLLDRMVDPTNVGVRVENTLARAEFAQVGANRAAAEQWMAIADVLDDAQRHPELFVDPALPMRPDERIDFAERAAAADIAVRLSISEASVRMQGHDASTLRSRMPRLWSAFLDGEASAVKARTAADLVRSLPDDTESNETFDVALTAVLDLAPGRFRLRARVLRERIHSVALVERVRAAHDARAIWIENGPDGMVELGLNLPAEDGHLAFARIDAEARALVALPGESRTLAQVRADVAAALLVRGEVAGVSTGARVTVAVTVPVLTAMGLSDEPGALEGYGPIDAETARRLAADAPSFTRLLTHPISGALLDIDRETYRVPAHLRRWLRIVDALCRFPGCTRPARTSDLDHTVDYQHGGATRAGNLAHLCRHHHRVKHMTRWKVRATPDTERRVEWTSPTGFARAADPPPF